ncbi:urease accessory protein UreF [Mesorhizobium sp. M8A.F.Ca.ET.173.01.1.1]|nr:urease accessory protein UreF [Mesorhizobium sp. M8A.F.Ca.ET.173.01.1.1]
MSAVRMSPEQELAIALQMGDSAYPTGTFAYSWGLETLIADGSLSGRDLANWAGAELVGRWYGLDRIAHAGGWRAENLQQIEEWDGVIDAHHWSEKQRRHSGEAGAVTLTAARRMELPAAKDISASVAEGRMVGHLAVVTGALHRASGLQLRTSLLMSGLGFLRGQLSVAVRLGKAGALEAQAIIMEFLPEIAKRADPPKPGEWPRSFSPLSDIAQMRPHAMRLFVN